MSASTMRQSSQLSALLKDLSRTKVQRLVDNFDLLEFLMDSPRLGGVDRTEFEQLVKGKAKRKPASAQPRSRPQSSVSPTLIYGRFTPVEQYAERILARSKLRSWGLDNEDTLKLVFGRSNTELHRHAGPLKPTGARVWLDGSLADNWSESLLWLRDELEAAGFEPNLKLINYLEQASIAWYPGSELSVLPNVKAMGLDFETFWDSRNGLAPSEIRPKRPIWPGLEVVQFLALNPQYCNLMDGQTIPYLLALGLVIGSEDVPFFGRDERKLYVGASGAGRRWDDTSLVAFREL